MRGGAPSLAISVRSELCGEIELERRFSTSRCRRRCHGAAVVTGLIDIGHDLATGRLHTKLIPGFADRKEARLSKDPARPEGVFI